MTKQVIIINHNPTIHCFNSKRKSPFLTNFEIIHTGNNPRLLISINKLQHFPMKITPLLLEQQDKILLHCSVKFECKLNNGSWKVKQILTDFGILPIPNHS